MNSTFNNYDKMNIQESRVLRTPSIMKYSVKE